MSFQVSNDTVWVFVHIPKTAGTTFKREIAPQWFPTGRHMMAYTGFGPEEQARRREKFSQPDVVHKTQIIGGHDVYGLADSFGKPVQHFSFFRHPVDRMVSWWFHHRDRPEGRRPGWDWIYRNFDNCGDYIRATNPIMEDIYCYLSPEENFSYEEKLRTHLGPDCQYQKSQPLFRNLATLTLPEHAPELYEEMRSVAFSRIENAVPLISEMFDESIECLAHLTGKPMVSYKAQRVADPTDKERLEVAAQLPELRQSHPEADQFYKHLVARFQGLHAEVIKQKNG